MTPFLQGILVGMALAVLVGPLVFTLVQTSVEQGFRAGLMVAAGIWSSDMTFAALSWFGLHQMEALVQWKPFPTVVGLAGGLVLIAFGGLLLLHTPDLYRLRSRKAVRYSAGVHLWAQGFLINALNPFSFFFWLGISTTFLLRQGWSGVDAAAFYSGILGTLVLTDTAKAGLARMVRRYLRPRIILGMRRMVGATLIFFGILLVGRTCWVHVQAMPAF